MEQIAFWIKLIFGIIIGFIGYLAGGFDTALLILIGATILDCFTGILAAIMNKSLTSKVMFSGGFRKIGMFSVVIVAHWLDVLLVQTGFEIVVLGGMTAAMRLLAIGYYLGNEGLSILENVGMLGAPLPKFIVNALGQLRNHFGDVE